MQSFKWSSILDGEMGYGDFEYGRRIAIDEFLVNLQRNEEEEDDD